MAGLIKQNSKRNVRGNLNAEINITPFVDVMLVLLIIFMITSPMLVTGISLDLPKVDNSSTLNLKEEPLTIDVDKDGDIYIQKSKIDIDSFGAKLKSITNEKYDTKIVIRGDESTGYGSIMNVIVIIKSSGFDKVALINSNKILKWTITRNYGQTINRLFFL